jgi:hypothetical protein
LVDAIAAGNSTSSENSSTCEFIDKLVLAGKDVTLAMPSPDQSIASLPVVVMAHRFAIGS